MVSNINLRTPAPYTKTLNTRLVGDLRDARAAREVSRCKLDPSLKASSFKISNLMKRKVTFNLNLVF